MGFWSGLGNIFKHVVPFIPGIGPAASELLDITSGLGKDVTDAARQFDPALTGGGGGGSSIWQKIAGVLTGKGTAGQVAGTAGDVASGIEAGRAKDRENQNSFNTLQDRTKLQAQSDFENALENRAGLELKQQTAGQDYQGNAYHQALLGALGKNTQDVGVGNAPPGVNVVNFSGGLRPSAMGPEGRAAAALMNEKAMQNLKDGLKTTPLPEIERFTPSDYKTGNIADTILGTIGTIGKAGDIFNERGQKSKDQSWIDKIRADIEASEKAKMQPPVVPGAPVPPQAPRAPMIDPLTGQPIIQPRTL